MSGEPLKPFSQLPDAELRVAFDKLPKGKEITGTYEAGLTGQWCWELFECPICNLIWAEVWPEGAPVEHNCARCNYGLHAQGWFS